MSMSSNLLSLTAPGQGPQEDQVTPQDRLRDALAVRCTELEMTRPEVLDLTAEVLAELHSHLAGRASALAGNRPPKYFRETLRGEHALTLEDLTRLAIDAPTALGPALDLLARAAGHRIVIPHDVALPTSITEAHAALMEAAVEFHAALLRGADREVTDPLAEKVERRWVALRTLGRRESR